MGHNRFSGAVPNGYNSVAEKYGYLPYALSNVGEDFVLGRFNMAVQSPYVSRQQVILQVGYDGSVTMTAVGKPKTWWRSGYGGQWNYLQPGESRILQSGDSISLDAMNPEAAVFTCQNEGGGNQQGGYGQQQGGYGGGYGGGY